MRLEGRVHGMLDKRQGARATEAVVNLRLTEEVQRALAARPLLLAHDVSSRCRLQCRK
jgi:hypothetical protein